MTRFSRSESGAVILWVLGSMLLSAVITPWIYLWGKQLGVHVAIHDANAFLAWLGEAAARSKFGRFYSRALLLSAVVLLPLLIWRVRSLSRSRGDVGRDESRRRLGWRRGMIQWAAAVVIAGLLLLGLGLLLADWQAFSPREAIPPFKKWLSRAIIPALAASLVEEWLFRGILLTLWLRVARPQTAAISTALVFAFVHFLSPPGGAEITDPTHPFAGFELLGLIVMRFAEPIFFAAQFAVLFVIGWILAWSRLKTGALWFAVGLHAGWVFAFRGFNLLYLPVSDSPLRPLWIGPNLDSGLLPLLMLALTAGICWIVWRFPFFRTAQPETSRS